MDQETHAGKLASLTADEAKLLYMKCRREPYLTISFALEIGTGEKHVRERAVTGEMGRLYDKLGFPSDLRRKEVLDEHLQPYQELFFNNSTSLESIDEGWPPEWLLSLLAQELEKVREVGEVEEEDVQEEETGEEHEEEVSEEEDFPPPPTTPIAEEPPSSEDDTQPRHVTPPEEPTGEPPIEIEQPEEDRRNLWIGIAIGVVIIISVCGCIFFFQFFWPFISTWGRIFTPVEESVTDQPSPTLTETLIPLVTSTVTLSPTATSTPTEIVTPTITLTSTNTDTPLPTNTPLPSPTPIPILFEDNFDDGLDPSWQVIKGEELIVNGQLSAKKETWLIVGLPSWTNYQIEFVATEYHTSSSVGVHFQDLDNMVAFNWHFTGSLWYIVENGIWNKIEPTRTGNIGYPPQPITVRVEGDLYTSELKGKEPRTFVDTTYPSGQVAIRLDSQIVIDDFRIIEMP